MAKGIRTKPCGNCKKSKVKCEYDNTLPCVRCVSNGLASSCHFVIRLPSLKFPLLDSSQTNKPYDGPEIPPKTTTRPLDSMYNSAGSLPNPGLLPNPIPGPFSTPLPSLVPNRNIVKHKPLPLHPKGVPKDSLQNEPDLDWRLSMESKLDSVDAKFNSILSVLEANQKALLEKQKGEDTHATKGPEPSNEHSTESIQAPEAASSSKRSHAHDKPESIRKRARYGPGDFRENVLSIEEAKTLFKFFDENIAQQLFGFEIKRFVVDVVWESSPILVCTICTIALMHYPGPELSGKQETLQTHLRELCTNVLFASRPRTEQEAFNTIVSLVLCSFWLSDSQMFTGLALQLAKEFNLNRPALGESRESSLDEQDRIKLWYLLFILDGQQSMTLNRQSLVSSEDYTLRNLRQLLMKSEPRKLEAKKKDLDSRHKGPEELPTPQDTHYGRLNDLRLVSQVEYNIALSESFKGNAWDLLAPTSFGIPSRSNLELDKWMVSWTVLLAPMKNGAVWLSKSTLIYYNFAKMHINSSVIRQLQEDRGGNGLLLPNWKNYKTPTQKNEIPSNTVDNEKLRGQPELEEANSSDEDDEDEDDFVSNSGLVTQDQALVSYNIAVSAAQTVLSLVLSDPDILNNLKYVPVHIHMMLYYASILLVSPSPLALEGDSENARYFHDVVEKLKTVRLLQNKVYLNFPTDRLFGDQLIQNLDNLFGERISSLMAELHTSPLGVSQKAELINEISMLQFTSMAQTPIPSPTGSSSRASSPRPERIYAWPGSHHGHP
ncbi:hypothetical protein METBIDRAFT_78643 [Metschnikowia bicuspidata var. bicuspidata NRRL YB-4993]|uniref:Zn(2)-C6 fungal-type domain-containing protein n=1 Tax=Metschnikowia bicuspidata var. bicuspidata NRRL YB-4993 TaxID=869754 RepID=A0A1A0H840_9ASCO|nr:hypothetical protein METBIDRAFT_78643 [Metschnikowia bicuspidata var. bicuspidata NRRL YB-4993]OBA20186.1 hypothetical protein METBIDRAFT_78643 [Metschnikowia bicuspidata var. bicuspidata NRRL YB-4993]